MANLYKAYTTEEWIEKAKLIHPEIDYSECVYKNKETKMTFICKKHGKFTKLPRLFLKSEIPCSYCKHEKERKEISDMMMKKIKEVWKDKDYDLSNAEYIKSDVPIKVICNKHKYAFYPLPSNILNKHTICPKCAIEKNTDRQRKTFDTFIKEAREIHGDKYEYDESTYGKKVDDDIRIICPEHGEFWQSPHSHIGQKQGCPFCGKIRGGLKHRSDAEEVLNKIKELHKHDNYSYEKFSYEEGVNTYIDIYCHKTYSNGKEHGYFRQMIQNHIAGQGCPRCRSSHLERLIKNALMDKEFGKIDEWKRFEWLGKLSLDFYLSEYNIAIECQGSQHYLKDHFMKDLEVVQERDLRKKKLCKEHGLTLLYFTEPNLMKYVSEDDLPNTYSNVTDLINRINLIISRNKVT